MDVLEIARTWSFWDRPVPDSVARDVNLPAELRPSVALVIQGVRRCGKSTLTQQLIARYGLDAKDCAFLNLEDPRLSREMTWETLERLVTEFRAARPDASLLYFFLDEIQGVEGWQRWLRTRLDLSSDDIFIVTGSNARLLSGELSTTLTGRHLTVELFPFDIAERRRLLLDTTVDTYLADGWFPAPIASEDRDQLLRQYFLDIVERDVRERVGARSNLPVRQVAQMAFESAGSELSLRRVAGAVGVATETAGAYLDACEAAYLLFACPFFAFSERKRAARNVKYYPVDTGLRRVVSTRGGADLGKALECATFLALRRRHRDVFYWRAGGEVDFVVDTGDAVVPVQVTWDESSERHHRALEEFYEQHRHAQEAVFVTASSFEQALDSV